MDEHDAVTPTGHRRPADTVPDRPASRWSEMYAMLEQQLRDRDHDLALKTAEDVDWIALADDEPDAASRCRGWIALCMVYLGVGALAQAVDAAARAQAAAVDAADETLQTYASTLIAAGMAANGEHSGALRLLAELGDLAEASDEARRTAALARVIVAVRTVDVDAFDAAADDVEAIGSGGEVTDAILTVVASWRSLLHGRPDEAAASTLRVTHGSRRLRLPPVARAAAVSVRTRALIVRGDALRALGALDGARSPAGHAVCLSMLRARVYLSLDRPRDALRATDGCLRLGDRHSLATLTGVYLHRAVALERLGHSDAADAMFVDGLHLARTAVSLVSLAVLPDDTVDALWDRSAVADDTRLDQLREARKRAAPLRGPRAPRRRVPDFSPREAIMARALVTGAPMSAIAEDLHISPNTVKSQTRAVYRKAGVSSRTELIDLLDDAGFGGSL